MLLSLTPFPPYYPNNHYASLHSKSTFSSFYKSIQAGTDTAIESNLTTTINTLERQCFVPRINSIWFPCIMYIAKPILLWQLINFLNIISKHFLPQLFITSTVTLKKGMIEIGITLLLMHKRDKLCQWS